MIADQPDRPERVAVAEPPAPKRQVQRWAFLNQYDFRRYGNSAFSLLLSRPTDVREASLGYALSGGEAVQVSRASVFVGGSQENEIRLVPADAFILGLSRYQLEGGLRLGPLRPLVRVGFTTVHLDFGHGFSLGLLSPRVGAGLGLSVGGLRLGASAFVEYLWRWLGDESAFVHGLTIELQLPARAR